MFKFVVFCAFVAAAVAEPSGLLTAPLAYSSSIAAPLAYSGAIAAPATYISPAGGYIQPTIYSTPYGISHLIKKRSAPFAYNGYIAPTTYLASSPIATTYTTPYVSSAAYPIAPVTYSTATHFIKKRSAPLALPATYIAPTTYAATPYVSTAYSTPLYSTPYISTPVTYPAHFIKKRSAALAYAAPAISHQSRIDYTAPVVSSYAAINPIGYNGVAPLSYAATAPIAYSGTYAYLK